LFWGCVTVSVLGVACSADVTVTGDGGRLDRGLSDSADAGETCLDGKKNQDETDTDCGGAICASCLEGKACTVDSDCTSQACVGNICRLCKDQAGSCLGNLVRVCNSDQASWTTVATCDPVAGEVCNAVTQTCDPIKPIGSADATGTYYLYTMFTKGSSEFKGGYDVDSFVSGVGDSEENLIYVNRSNELDVYKVELIDSDQDGKLEPNQHPDNVDATGPIEGRKLTFVKTYTSVKLGQPSRGEIYAESDRIYFLSADTSNTSNIYEFIFQSETTNLLVAGNPKIPLAVLGFDPLSKRWYGGWNSTTRRVYGYYADGGGWAAEFDYPNLAGTHMDGLEVVIDPKTKTSYLYVSDMTSDFLAQYYQDASGAWVQKNVFKYMETASQAVEGMGFGAFQHFWITSGNALYEVGGGDLQKFVGPD